MNNFESPQNSIENKEQNERGKDVLIVAQYMRHGERTKDGKLLNIGREITKQRAVESGDKKENFHAVKAYGSQAGPKNEEGMGRALETAHIYANEIAEDEAKKTRPLDVLNYENIVSSFPYNHNEIYNENLPEDFETLSDNEKVQAAKKAQRAVIDHLMQLNTSEADSYKREIAGAFAYDLLHLAEMTNKLKKGSRVLTPRGTHGGLMEFLLKEAITHEDEQDNVKVGLDNLDEIGGEFNPSDSYKVFVERNENGEMKKMKVSFDNPNRPDREFWLDYEKVKELAENYKKLHNERT